MRVGVIIAGGRDFNNRNLMDRELDRILSERYGDDSVTIITGGAKGADSHAEALAVDNGYSNIVMSALWDVFKKSAGVIRNSQMADKALTYEKSLLIAFWDGKSPGTKNMILTAERKGIETIKINY